MSSEETAKQVGFNLVIPVGALALLGALMLSVSNEASIGLRLGEQNNEAIMSLQGEVRGLREDLQERTEDRYTSADAARDLAYIQRDIAELKQTVREQQGK
jgi:phage-related tail protein